MGLFSRKKQETHPYCVCLVPAAGRGTRMGEEIDKLLLPLDGRPVLAHTLAAIEACPVVDEILVVTSESLILPVSDICREFGIGKLSKIVLGGETRAQSVFNGLREITSKPQLIAVHDGARPLAGPALIERVVRAATQTNAAAPAVSPKDTVKQVKNGQVQKTLSRRTLALVQTPQVFSTPILYGALTRAVREKWEITDDCQAVERIGMSVTLVPGDYANIKITTPEDMAIAEALLAQTAELNRI